MTGKMPVDNLRNLLGGFFSSRGFSKPEVSLLQPTEPFLDAAGEDLRRQIFITSDLEGHSLCLRPEFTIPVCLTHLQSGPNEGSYAYGGSVFRQSHDGPVEFTQAGIETIGGKQDYQSDVNCITTALDALAQCGLQNMQLVFGDQEIFEVILHALDLPDAWRTRLERAFGDGEKLKTDLALIAARDDDIFEAAGMDDALRNGLKANDNAAVEAWVGDKMNTANLPARGGRTAQDISRRMLNKTQLATSQLSDDQRRVLTDYLGLDLPLGQASERLMQFADSNNLKITGAINKFNNRAQLLQAFTSEAITIRWRADFGRRLDYYTGIVFEIFEPGHPEPVCGGGRYDHLMKFLGATQEMPAIGFSIWLDRLKGVAG